MLASTCHIAPKGGKAKSAELFCKKLSFFPFDSSTAKSAKKFSNISLCSRNPAFVTIPFIIYLHSFVIAKHTISAINRNPAFTNSLMSFPCCLFPKPAWSRNWFLRIDTTTNSKKSYIIIKVDKLQRTRSLNSLKSMKNCRRMKAEAINYWNAEGYKNKKHHKFYFYRFTFGMLYPNAGCSVLCAPIRMSWKKDHNL